MKRQQITVVYIPGDGRSFALWCKQNPQYIDARIIYATGPQDVYGLDRVDQVVMGYMPDGASRQWYENCLKTREAAIEVYKRSHEQAATE